MDFLGGTVLHLWQEVRHKWKFTNYLLYFRYKYHWWMRTNVCNLLAKCQQAAVTGVLTRKGWNKMCIFCIIIFSLIKKEYKSNIWVVSTINHCSYNSVRKMHCSITVPIMYLEVTTPQTKPALHCLPCLLEPCYPKHCL